MAEVVKINSQHIMLFFRKPHLRRAQRCQLGTGISIRHIVKSFIVTHSCSVHNAIFMY